MAKDGFVPMGSALPFTKKREIGGWNIPDAGFGSGLEMVAAMPISAGMQCPGLRPRHLWGGEPFLG